MASNRTQHPVSTGSSVIGIVYDGGVMIAADHLASYGSMARFRTCQRVMRVNDITVLGAGGDYADFQHVANMIEQKQIDEDAANDGFTLTPKALYSWLTRVQYNKRCQFDPYWITWVVGGLQDGEPFLGFVDKLGLSYTDSIIATGYGMHVALPMLRRAQEAKNGDPFTIDEAKNLLKSCLTVLNCRDARSFPSYHIAVADYNGSRIEGPFEVKPNWDFSVSPHVLTQELPIVY